MKTPLTGSVGVTLSLLEESVLELLENQISSELLVVVYLHVYMRYFNVTPLNLPPPSLAPPSLALPSLPSFLSSVSRLELLSTITEIRGYLRIEGWQDQTFPYLRSLRRVGSPNGTADNTFCNDGLRCEFSFLHLSSTANLIFAF